MTHYGLLFLTGSGDAGPGLGASCVQNGSGQALPPAVLFGDDQSGCRPERPTARVTVASSAARTADRPSRPRPSHPPRRRCRRRHRYRGARRCGPSRRRSGSTRRRWMPRRIRGRRPGRRCPGIEVDRGDDLARDRIDAHDLRRPVRAPSTPIQTSSPSLATQPSIGTRRPTCWSRHRPAPRTGCSGCPPRRHRDQPS